jgi:hypothetical protein
VGRWAGGPSPGGGGGRAGMTMVVRLVLTLANFLAGGWVLVVTD